MKGGDLDNRITPRYWVVSDVVLHRQATSDSKRSGWFKTMFSQRVTWIPDLAALSKLWRWSSNMGVRLELLFVEDMTGDAPELWQMLDKVANPFSTWLPYENFSSVAADLAWRPDVLGVIDRPSRTGIYGGKGIDIGSIP